MRKQVLLLLVVLLSLTSCGDSWFGDKNSKPGQVETISGTLTGKWKVVVARAGDENIAGLYDGYVIEFTQDGKYIITNPGGAPNPNRNSPANSGLWIANVDNSITLDATVLMRIIDGISTDRMKFSWDVSILNKGTVTYYWEIVPA